MIAAVFIVFVEITKTVSTKLHPGSNEMPKQCLLTFSRTSLFTVWAWFTIFTRRSSRHLIRCKTHEKQQQHYIKHPELVMLRFSYLRVVLELRRSPRTSPAHERHRPTHRPTRRAARLHSVALQPRATNRSGRRRNAQPKTDRKPERSARTSGQKRYQTATSLPTLDRVWSSFPNCEWPKKKQQNHAGAPLWMKHKTFNKETT